VAHAQLSANVALTSNYKYRGQDQGAVKQIAPAIQGGFDYSAGGLYLGNWNSNTGIGIEMDVYGGYKFELAGVGLDVGLLHYRYPDTQAANTTELYLGGSLGMFGLKYSHTVSKAYFGEVGGRGTGYVALTANPELAKGLTANLALGYTNKESPGAASYTDWKAGITHDLGGGLSAAGAVVGGNKTAAYAINKNRFIVTLSKAM
jgi:uncharacterized protein (TIGR02001 family)